MAVTQISRISHRRGLRIDLPNPLNDAEFGWAEDTLELFIGNGPLSPAGGNTQILTEHIPASLLKYTYESNTSTLAVTGFDAFGDPSIRNANFATVRSYQDKFDDFVTVYDYGAKGNGIVDDYPALKRAIEDLYDEISSPTADARKFRVLYFPAGTYLISKNILLYPNCVLMGAGSDSTKIILTDPGLTPTTDQYVVARTCDSKGRTLAAIDGTADFGPGNVRVFGITFQNDISQNASFGQKDIINLDRAINVRFEDCAFIGTWDFVSASFYGSRGVYITDSNISGTPKIGNYSFVNCLFAKISIGMELITNNLSNVLINNSNFDNLNRGLSVGTNGNPTPFGGPNESTVSDVMRFIRISNSYMTNIVNVGVHVRTTGIRGFVSSNNFYSASGGVFTSGAIIFENGTDTCVSIHDTFADNSIVTCINKFNNPRVRNLSTLRNIVMNTQDSFQIPGGFCGSLLIDGNFETTGNIDLNGWITQNRVSSTPTLISGSVYLVATIPFIEGNVIFFDYGMNQSNTIYRVGTLRVVHNSGLLLDDSDSYTELGGPPSSVIKLYAAIVGSDIQIRVDTTSTLPSYNYLIRKFTV